MPGLVLVPFGAHLPQDMAKVWGFINECVGLHQSRSRVSSVWSATCSRAAAASSHTPCLRAALQRSAPPPLPPRPQLVFPSGGTKYDFPGSCGWGVPPPRRNLSGLLPDYMVDLMPPKVCLPPGAIWVRR